MMSKFDGCVPEGIPLCVSEDLDPAKMQPMYEHPPHMMTISSASFIPGHACKDSVPLEDELEIPAKVEEVENGTSSATSCFSDGRDKILQEASTKWDPPPRMTSENVVPGTDLKDKDPAPGAEDMPRAKDGCLCKISADDADVIIEDTKQQEEGVSRSRRESRTRRNSSAKGRYVYRLASKYFDRFRTSVHLDLPRAVKDLTEGSPDDVQDWQRALHECHLCPFSTRFKRDLVQHVWSHTGEKPYKCSSCEYSARSVSHLVVHQRKHTGEKPYKCDECPYATIRKSYLVIHRRKHTGERPFKCLFCSYATAAKWRLMVHMRTHTGERPYKCHFCDYTAAQKGNVAIHERSHTILPT